MQAAPAGDNAQLITLPDDITAAELHAAARAAREREGVVGVIVGHSSLYVIEGSLKVSESQSLRDLCDFATLRLRVSFIGPDLPAFLSHTHQTLEQFLQRIPPLTARYLGFRGGFAYLDGWPAEWAMPRRPTSRPVARGSFAIAGGVAGFYPIDSPGGWNLLGRTDADLFHAIAPGDVIVIEPTLEILPPPPLHETPRLEIEGVEILSAPLVTLVEPPDWSRVERGLSPGGPFDDLVAGAALRGVERCAALLECAMVWPRLRFIRERVVSRCGPDGEMHIERVRGDWHPGRIANGLRGYVAIGEREGVITKIERGERNVIRAIAGPHDVGVRELTCEVTPQLDRVGIRMKPVPSLEITTPGDLRSIGMQCGSLQLHPDGSVVAMGPDHPVTGGYLQPMTVITSERWKLAQLSPGERVTFVASQRP